ncbi:MAG: hypothetical protein OSJ74_00215 [Clostridia bacterium]|nr:hypothetical protein [Clostridia bacterium]
MKKTVAIIAVVAMILGATACFVGCDNSKEAVATTYVSMDINPSIRFVLDQNEKVISYSCENEDACILLYGEAVIGLDISQAAQKIMDLAVEMGYLTQDNCGVQVVVASDKSKVESKILDKIQVVVENTDNKLSFDINYNKEGSFVLNYQLAKLKEKYPDNQDYQNLTAGKLRLVYSAMAVDYSLKMDDAVKMSSSQLIAIVDDAYSQLEEYSTKAFEEAKRAAEQVYQAAVSATQEAVYIAKYVEYKGIVEGGLAVAEYGGLSVASKSIDILAKSLILAENVADKILQSEETMAIAEALGVDIDELKDEQGNVTVGSIEAYVDKVAKNTADNMTQEMRSKLNQAVESLEEYKLELQDKPLSQDAVAKIQSLLANIKINDIEFVDFTIDDLKAIAVELDEKATAIKAKMDASLTQEQIEEIQTAQKQAVEKLDGALEEYNQAVDKAAQEAKAYLQSLKEARLESLNPKS